MKEEILVGDAMTTTPITCSGDSTLVQAAKMMKKQKVGSLLVVKEKRIIGIITERDFVVKVLAKEVNPKEALIADFMSKDLVTVTPDIDINKAMNIMRMNDLRRLPVVENKSLKGMLTAKDILKIQPELFAIAKEMFEIREANRKPLQEVDDPLEEYEKVMDKKWED